jgi:putative redox protein
MSVEIDVEYTGDLHCDAVHRPSGRKLSTDAPLDNGGRGESFSATDLVATGLGSCVLTIMALESRRRGIELAGMRARVVKEMVSQPRRRIGRLAVDIGVPGWTELDATMREDLESAIDQCPVKESLLPEVDISIRIGDIAR